MPSGSQVGGRDKLAVQRHASGIYGPAKSFSLLDNGHSVVPVAS
jgi:hypothetical protein